MQTKGGGKHDILSVARATATTLDCLWMMPRDPDAVMCPGTETAPVSTEECMAHQSFRCRGNDGDRSSCGAGMRAFSQVGGCENDGGDWPANGDQGAQLGVAT